MSYSVVESAEDIVAQKLFRLFGSNSSDWQSRTCADLVSETIVTSGYEVEKILDTADAKGCDLKLAHRAQRVRATSVHRVNPVPLPSIQLPCVHPSYCAL